MKSALGAMVLIGVSACVTNQYGSECTLMDHDDGTATLVCGDASVIVGARVDASTATNDAGAADDAQIAVDAANDAAGEDDAGFDAQVADASVADAGPDGAGSDAGLDARSDTLLEGSFSINNSLDLAAFRALSPTRITGTLSIAGAGISSLAGLSSLERVDGDVIIDRLSAGTLAGLENLRYVGGQLTLGNYAGSSIEALSNLEHVGGFVAIGACANLLDVNPVFESLESVGSISVGGCPLIESIEIPLVTSAAQIYFSSNAAVTSISMPALETTTSNILLETMDNLETVSFASLTSTTQLGLNNMAVTTVSLPSLTTITGAMDESLTLVNLDAASIDFPVLAQMAGGLVVDSNDTLGAVSFPALTTMGPLRIWNNSSMIALSLPALETATRIDARTNPGLTDFSLPSIESLDAVYFENCAMLPDCRCSALGAAMASGMPTCVGLLTMSAECS